MCEAISTVALGAGQVHLLGWPGLRKGHDGRGWISPEDRAEALERLARHGCRDLMGLTEHRELPLGTRAGLRAAAAAAGIMLWSAPIRDYQPPDARFLRRWGPLLDRWAVAVRGGGQIAFACMAGAGRSGTLAALVMIRAGTPPAAAMAAIRAANPLAIESPAQEAWLTARMPGP